MFGLAKVMDMHEEGTMLQSYGVNAEAESGVPSQRTEPHMMDRNVHIHHNPANGPGSELAHSNVNTANSQRIPGHGRGPQGLSNLSTPGSSVQDPTTSRESMKQGTIQEPGNGVRHTQANSIVSIPQAVSSEGGPDGQGAQVAQGGQQSEQNIHSPRLAQPGQRNDIQVNESHGIEAHHGHSPNTGEGVEGNESGNRTTDRHTINNGAGQGAEEVRNTVASIGEMVSGPNMEPHSDGNMQGGVQGIPPVHLQNTINKDGIMYHQPGSTGMILTGGGNDGRMSLGTMAKKSARMPGTKQCPTCRNTIAAAVARCPKCPHVFREKKEKVKRSGKRGKKNCPKCKFENPSACSSCKQCKYIFRLKLMEKYKTMRPSRQGSETSAAAAAAAAVAAAQAAGQAQTSMHAQHPGVPGAIHGAIPVGVSGGVGTMPIPASVSAFPSQLSQAMHMVPPPGMSVMAPMPTPSLALPAQSHSLHATNMAQMQHQIPQHPMQPHQTHPQL